MLYLISNLKLHKPKLQANLHASRIKHEPVFHKSTNIKQYLLYSQQSALSTYNTTFHNRRHITTKLVAVAKPPLGY